MDYFGNTEIPESAKKQLRERQNEIVKIIEAIEGLEEIDEWKTLKELLFDKATDAIERQIKNEALSNEINSSKLYRLQGEWAWARQYSDTKEFVRSLKQQLEGIKNKLQ